MALAPSGQMGLICSTVDSRYVKKMPVIKIYVDPVHADEVPGRCYLQFNTSSPWIFLFCFVFILWPFWGQEKKKRAKGFRECERGQAAHTLKKQEAVCDHRHR